MLLIVRKEGSLVYGGNNLTEDFEDTFDHVICVERIVDDLDRSFVDVSVTSSSDVAEHFRLSVANKEHRFGDFLDIALIGFCRPSKDTRSEKPSVRLGFDAPRTYRLVRDNAVKRTD